MNQFTFYANKPSQNYNKVDIWLLASILLLWGLGIFTLYVCSQNFAIRAFGDALYFVKRQLLCSAVGFVLFAGFLITDMKYIRKMVSVIVIVSLVLCFLTFIPGISIIKNGARRWIKLPGNFTFQPSELVKFAIVVFLANYFDKQDKLLNPDDKTVFPCVIALIVFAGVVFMQKDFSSGVFITLIGILLFFVSGAKLVWIFPFALIAIPAAFLMITLNPYRLQRLIGWISPDQYSSSINYQSINAKRAISAGGVWGSGIGAGLSKINSIPEVQADYIFAGWAEAMGYIGVVLYFVLLVFFAYRGYKAALSNPDKFSALSAFGCVSVIVLQSIVNTMVVCGVLPSTGINLPFFSLGGSSIIVTLAMCGFILNASRCEKIDEKVTENDEINIESLSYL
ncbi:cell division protein FtsW [Treponema bryantii]|uniref:Probable peptidoglycan glycosyltransferase FtsW n=1 Tax=Treponema bryantii TaxID=163 RepID=A0A1I3M3G6_9SPIR|nr:putative peptidoglycan glycosyltransferase FtsW [Treponema bryantii]SFI91467.1 cell division protein FtsW [Treponema bryantii]